MFFSCGVIANFVFCVTKMLIPQGVARCQHSSTPHTSCAVWRGNTPGVSSLYRVLSSPVICSRCGWVKAICEAISSLLGHETHETRRKALPGWKEKKARALKERKIQSRKLRFPRLRFSHYQSGQSAISYK